MALIYHLQQNNLNQGFLIPRVHSIHIFTKYISSLLSLNKLCSAGIFSTYVEVMLIGFFDHLPVNKTPDITKRQRLISRAMGSFI